MGRIFANVDERLALNGIVGRFHKNKIVTLLGWNNSIKVVGSVHCENPDDRERAIEVLKECGYNYCKINHHTKHGIEVMYDTDYDDWGIKV